MESRIQVCLLLICSNPAFDFSAYNNAYKKDCDDLFTQFDVKGSIDILHAVVTEAQARAESGKLGPDIWKENLDPRTSMRARTVPVLENEKKRLQEVLDEVRLLLQFLSHQRAGPLYIQTDFPDIPDGEGKPTSSGPTPAERQAKEGGR